MHPHAKKHTKQREERDGGCIEHVDQSRRELIHRNSQAPSSVVFFQSSLGPDWNSVQIRYASWGCIFCYLLAPKKHRRALEVSICQTHSFLLFDFFLFLLGNGSGWLYARIWKSLNARESERVYEWRMKRVYLWSLERHEHHASTLSAFDSWAEIRDAYACLPGSISFSYQPHRKTNTTRRLDDRHVFSRDLPLGAARDSLVLCCLAAPRSLDFEMHSKASLSKGLR